MHCSDFRGRTSLRDRWAKAVAADQLLTRSPLSFGERAAEWGNAKWGNVRPFLGAPTLRTSVRLASPPPLFLRDHFCSFISLTLGQEDAGKVLATEEDPGSGNITHFGKAVFMYCSNLITVTVSQCDRALYWW